MPANILRFVPGFESLGLDLRLVGFTLGLAVLTACIFGILPALQAARSSVADALKEGGRSATGRQLLRRAIVVAEMSIALPLLVAAGMGVLGTQPLPQRAAGLRSRRPPGDAAGAAGAGLSGRAAQRQFADARARCRFAPCRASRSRPISNVLPAANGNSTAIGRGRRPPDRRSARPAVGRQPAGHARLFRHDADPDPARTRLHRRRSGRQRHGGDRLRDRWRRSCWPGEDPIGRRVKVKGGPWLTVVGISRRRHPRLVRQPQRADAVSPLRAGARRTSSASACGRAAIAAALAGAARKALLARGPDAAGLRSR